MKTEVIKIKDEVIKNKTFPRVVQGSLSNDYYLICSDEKTVVKLNGKNAGQLDVIDEIHFKEIYNSVAIKFYPAYYRS